jgi:ELWxxDGT repeat protein
MLLFAAAGTNPGLHLWRSDGTAAGTMRVKEPFLSLPVQIIQARPDGRSLFTVNNLTAQRRELWETDGTAPGTLPIQQISPFIIDSELQDFTIAGSHTFFTANDGSSGLELWVIDNVDLGPPLLRDRAVIANGAAISGTLGFADSTAYPLTYRIAANGGKGVAAITDPARGAFTYTPKLGARGSDRFTFSADDGEHAPVTAAVTVLLGPFGFLPKVSQ